MATIVGYIIVGVLVVVAFHFVIGTILWLFRTLVIVVVILALVTIYLKLKTLTTDRYWLDTGVFKNIMRYR